MTTPGSRNDLPALLLSATALRSLIVGFVEDWGPLVGLVGGGLGIVTSGVVPAAKWVVEQRRQPSAQARLIYASVDRSGGQVRALLRNESTEPVTNVCIYPAIPARSDGQVPAVLEVPRDMRYNALIGVVQELRPGSFYVDKAIDLSGAPPSIAAEFLLHVSFTDARHRHWDRVANGDPVTRTFSSMRQFALSKVIPYSNVTPC